ncbi:MAG TPA: type III-A CRISPR-associated RAMP protein Csm5 [Blastocatellia bacterium]|nr:type III-A CRISPR-associated RAMP protein Csm5 [Blastocatellia bacterium]
MSRYRYTIETLAPVHIGTGEVLSPLEYYPGEEFIVPDLDRLFAAYPDAATAFSRQLAARSAAELARTGLGELLAADLLGDRRVWRYAAPAFYNEELNFDALKKLREQAGQGQAEVRLATKTPDSRPYLPGSSIKGALKTAWAYEQCRRSPGAFEVIVKLLEDRDRAPQAEAALKSQVFQAPEQRDVAYDVFRVVSIGDSAPLSPDALILVAERVLSAAVRPGVSQADAAFKNYWVFCEAIDEKNTMSGEVRFDDRLLNDPNARRVMRWSEAQRGLTMESLRAAVNGFAADLCAWERRYFESIRTGLPNCDVEGALAFYEDLQKEVGAAPADTMYFSLGHGSGWHKLTIGLLLEKQTSREQFAQFRRNVRLADRHADFEYPKSRKLIMNGETSAYGPFGWVKMAISPQETA